MTEDAWTYQVLSLRHKNGEKAADAAAMAAKIRAENPQIAMEELYEQLVAKRDAGELDSALVLRLADPEVRSTQSLATVYRKGLEGLAKGQSSAAHKQVSRDGSTAYRIFYLEDYDEGTPPSYDEVLPQLQNALFGAAAQEEEERYITRLRERYGIDEDYLHEMVPVAFQPFSL